jgi:hypothetical protein
VQNELAKKLLKYAYHGEFTLKKICDLHKDTKQTEIKHFYKKTIQKGLLFMLDIFSLHNIYTLTDQIKHFIADSDKHSVLTQLKKNILLDPKPN